MCTESDNVPDNVTDSEPDNVSNRKSNELTNCEPDCVAYEGLFFFCFVVGS